MSIISTTIERISIGDETSWRNLTMFPLLNGSKGEAPYLTLDEAIAMKVAQVTEVSAGGTVPELKFVNKSKSAVLLLDGEELVGAKQNRILNLTVLAPSNKTLTIPVSCVEAGRWSHVSAEFASAPRAHYAAGRRMKMTQVSACMVATGARQSDQRAVWADISAKASRLSAHSATQAMSEIFEQHHTSLEDYVRAFQATDRQLGALFAIHGEIIGLDLFDYPGTLGKLLPKLVRSYALDAIEQQTEKTLPAMRSSAQELLDEVALSDAQSFPAIGLGEDYRLSGPHMTGAALVAEERIVHLSAFRTMGDGMLGDVNGSHFARASLRRQRFRQA